MPKAYLKGLDGGRLIEDGTIDVGDVPDGTLTNAKLVNAYYDVHVPFLFSGTASGDATAIIVDYVRKSGSYPVGVAFGITGTAAVPTAKIRVDVHSRKAVASGLASGNSWFKTKPSQAAALLNYGFTAAAPSTITTMASGAQIVVTRDKTGSATATTKVRGVVIYRVPLHT